MTATLALDAAIAPFLALPKLIQDHWSEIGRWWRDLWSDMGRVVHSTVTSAADAITEAPAKLVRSIGTHLHIHQEEPKWTSSGHQGALGKGIADQRLAQAMDYFQSQGWTPVQAAGISANVARESGFNEHAVGDGGSAFGLPQWHRDRAAALAAHFGKPVDQMSFGEQLTAINYELREGGEKKAGDALSHAGGAGEAGAIVSRMYERPAGGAAEADSRGMSAEMLMAQLSRGTPKEAQKVTLTVSGLPPGAKVTASSRDTKVDLSLGQHMAPAQ
jgi:hypothetical protein